VAGDGEATNTGFECPIANAVMAGNVDELELSTTDVRRATIQPTGWFAPDRKLIQREAEEGDGRGGISKHVAEDDATVVVDPAQPAVNRDDSVGLPDAELPVIIRVRVLAEAADWYAAGVPFAANATRSGYRLLVQPEDVGTDITAQIVGAARPEKS